MTLAYINQNLHKCLHCISKELIRGPLLLKKTVSMSHAGLAFLAPILLFVYKFWTL